MNFVMGLAHHRVSVKLSSRALECRIDLPLGDSEFFFCPTLVIRQKTYFSISSSFCSIDYVCSSETGSTEKFHCKSPVKQDYLVVDLV